MEQCKEPKDMSEAILAFDTLYTNNHMKILKLLMLIKLVLTQLVLRLHGLQKMWYQLILDIS